MTPSSTTCRISTLSSYFQQLSSAVKSAFSILRQAVRAIWTKPRELLPTCQKLKAFASMPDGPWLAAMRPRDWLFSKAAHTDAFSTGPEIRSSRQWRTSPAHGSHGRQARTRVSGARCSQRERQSTRLERPRETSALAARSITTTAPASLSRYAQGGYINRPLT